MLDLHLFHNLAIGIGVILFTFVIHGIALDLLIRFVNLIRPRAHMSRKQRHLRQISSLLSTALGLISLHSVEIWIWAFLYLALDIKEIVQMEHALYYSLASFSTLGPAGLNVSEQFRILSGMEGASGMILIGWSTAFLFEVMSITYERFNLRERS